MMKLKYSGKTLKFLFLLFTFVLLVSLGSGLQEIRNWTDFEDMSASEDIELKKDLTPQTPGYKEQGWDIGTISLSNDLQATFNGAGHKIKGLKIDGNGNDGVGLFNNPQDVSANIVNVSFINLTVINGGDKTGGLASTLQDNGARIENVFVNGSIEGSGPTGGIVGSFENGNLSNVIVDVKVTGQGNSGGIAGDFQDGIVRNSYSTSDVELGGNDGDGDALLAGTSSMPAGTVENLYYDKSIETSNLDQSIATGLTTAQMQGNNAIGNMSNLSYGEEGRWKTVLEEDSPSTEGGKVPVSDGYPVLRGPNRTQQIKTQGIEFEIPLITKNVSNNLSIGQSDSAYDPLFMRLLSTNLSQDIAPTKENNLSRIKSIGIRVLFDSAFNSLLIRSNSHKIKLQTMNRKTVRKIRSVFSSFNLDALSDKKSRLKRQHVKTYIVDGTRFSTLKVNRTSSETIFLPTATYRRQKGSRTLIKDIQLDRIQKIDTGEDVFVGYSMNFSTNGAKGVSLYRITPESIFMVDSTDGKGFLLRQTIQDSVLEVLSARNMYTDRKKDISTQFDAIEAQRTSLKRLKELSTLFSHVRRPRKILKRIKKQENFINTRKKLINTLKREDINNINTITSTPRHLRLNRTELLTTSYDNNIFRLAWQKRLLTNFYNKTLDIRTGKRLSKEVGDTIGYGSFPELSSSINRFNTYIMQTALRTQKGSNRMVGFGFGYDQNHDRDLLGTRKYSMTYDMLPFEQKLFEVLSRRSKQAIKSDLGLSEFESWLINNISGWGQDDEENDESYNEGDDASQDTGTGPFLPRDIKNNNKDKDLGFGIKTTAEITRSDATKQQKIQRNIQVGSKNGTFSEAQFNVEEEKSKKVIKLGVKDRQDDLVSIESIELNTYDTLANEKVRVKLLENLTRFTKGEKWKPLKGINVNPEFNASETTIEFKIENISTQNQFPNSIDVFKISNNTITPVDTYSNSRENGTYVIQKSQKDPGNLSYIVAKAKTDTEKSRSSKENETKNLVLSQKYVRLLQILLLGGCLFIIRKTILKKTNLLLAYGRLEYIKGKITILKVKRHLIWKRYAKINEEEIRALTENKSLHQKKNLLETREKQIEKDILRKKAINKMYKRNIEKSKEKIDKLVGILTDY